MTSSTAGGLAEIVPTYLLLEILGGILVLGLTFWWWRRSSEKSTANYQQVPVVVDEPLEDESDDVKKVTVFFGTQTGTAEGFAKVGQ